MELIDKNALVEYLERMGNEIYAGNGCSRSQTMYV